MNSDKAPPRNGAEPMLRLSESTIAHYDRQADAFRDGTLDHDVSQNYAALLEAIESDPPFSILDLGCGPGRDLRHFRSLGHEAVGLDGSQEFVAMARDFSGCEVLHQNSSRARLAREPLRRRLRRTRPCSTCRAGNCRGSCANSAPPCGRAASCSAPIRMAATRKA